MVSVESVLSSTEYEEANVDMNLMFEGVWQRKAVYHSREPKTLHRTERERVLQVSLAKAVKIQASTFENT